MGSVLHGHGGHGGLLSYSYSYSYSRLGLQNSGIVSCLSVAAAAARGGLGLRWQVLEQVDEELSKGDERAALSLVKDLQGKPDGLRCFGAARQLDILLKSLGFTQKKADSQVRWAVLNTVLILRRHEDTRAKLAEAMSEGRSVGGCINIIEETIDDDDI